MLTSGDINNIKIDDFDDGDDDDDDEVKEDYDKDDKIYEMKIYFPI